MTIKYARPPQEKADNVAKHAPPWANFRHQQSEFRRGGSGANRGGFGATWMVSGQIAGLAALSTRCILLLKSNKNSYFKRKKRLAEIGKA